MSIGLSVLIVALDSTWCVIREQPWSWNREDLPRDPGSQAGPSTFRPSLPQLQIGANVVTLFHNNVSAAARAVDARTHRTAHSRVLPDVPLKQSYLPALHARVPRLWAELHIRQYARSIPHGTLASTAATQCVHCEASWKDSPQGDQPRLLENIPAVG